MNAAEIASRLDLHRAGRNWRGSCPACGYGGDAFTLSAGRNGKPLLWCASCQDRDGIEAALQASTGGSLPERANDPAEAMKAAKRRAKSQERAISTWNGAAPVTPDDPAGRYFASRGLASLIGNACLRYRADTSHPGGGRWPAMIARVNDVIGNMVAVHRTYLTREGGKANVDPVKASLGPVMGSAIPLDPAGPEIVIGEGLETAASAGLMLNLPAWAAISAGNLERALALPDAVQSVVIAADPDEPGIRAAEAAAWRWQGEGRKARIIKPFEAETDFNDLWQRRMAREAA